MKCLHPIFITLSAYGLAPIPNVGVPCGKCEACLESRARDWQIRLFEEYSACTSAVFVTLTYRDDACTYISYDENSEKLKSYSGRYLPSSIGSFLPGVKNVPVVDKSHVHKFLKRLRKDNPGSNIRYFICSEYGPKTLRPHYHGIIFNLPKYKAYDSNYIAKVWSYGNVTISPVTVGRIKYVTKYCFGAALLPSALPKNFISTSRRPALGINYLDTVKKQWEKNHDFNDLHYHDTIKGRDLPTPRYYLRKLKEEIPEEYSIQAFLDYLNEEKWRDKQFDLEYSIRGDHVRNGGTWYETASEAKVKKFIYNFWKNYYKNRKL